MQIFAGLKVPTGFSDNMKGLVSMKDLSIKGKAHDCHVMLTVLLPISIRAIKPKYLKMVITQMCYFFNKILRIEDIWELYYGLGI